MKNLLILIFAVSFGSVCAQQKPNLKFQIQGQGGVWTGYNPSEESMFLGFVGPKVSLSVGLKKVTTEIGFTGVPGLFFGPKNRLGLVAGPTITLFKKGKKGKLVLGCMFYKNTVWYGVPGVGWTF